MEELEPVLSRINGPADVKSLSNDERETLAEELRTAIIETVSQTGGHLASNLGVVELTVALHTVFDSPVDKLVWDVGHQSYAHKLLTGRREAFHTLRQEGGLCGFTKTDESEHDPFGAGHASTSISGALGLAKARDLKGGNERVVAVIGDGSLTGGLALEGMNNAEPLKTDITVILNDNTMSIAENVGAVSLYLSKLRLAPLYQKVEARAKSLAGRMPAGKRITEAAEGISHGLVRLVGSKTGVFFEELGFTYVGPIDGHNIEVLIDVLETVKRQKGPVLVHVVTRKGKGYEYAENNARKFHGIPGFDIADGTIERVQGHESYTKVFSDTIVELALQDPRICAITAAMPDGTGLSKFAELYPDRFFDVGIAEEHAVTFAAGLAAGGMKPVVALYSSFLQRAFDQIIHDVCVQNLPVVFVVDRAGLVGEDGPTHHGAYDLSFLRQIPRMVIAAPKDTIELRDLLATAMRHDGPIAIRYPRGGGPCACDKRDPRILAIGEGERLRSGDDAIIICAGSTVYPALVAADALGAEEIGVEVINARFIKPLDERLISESLSKQAPVLVVEDNSVIGGLGSAVLELASSISLGVDLIKQAGIPDIFVEHCSLEKLRENIGIGAEGIAGQLRGMLARKASANAGSLSGVERK